MDGVAFPEFVGGPVKGTFDADLDASIQQMEDYAKLADDVAKTIDRFRRKAPAQKVWRNTASPVSAAIPCGCSD